MREIGIFEREEDAKRFADYLLTRKIAVQVRPQKGSWAIWAIPEDRVAQAREEFEAFRAEPDHPRYRQAASSAKEIRKEDKRAEKEYRKNFRDLTGYWDRARPSRALATHLLIIASVIIFFWTGGGYGPNTWYFRISNIPYPAPAGLEIPPLFEVREGQVWRLITPIFLHFYPFHLIFNMMALFYFGTQVEYKHGSLFLLAFVAGSGAVSNLAQYFDSGPGFGGMSGVAYALIGYAWLRSSYERTSGLYVHPQTMFIAMIWMLMGFLAPSMGMANIAHLSGLAFGLIAGSIPYLRQTWQAP